MSPKQRKRYVVSNLGFAFAVQDTQAPQTYQFEAGRGKEHPSRNVLNSKRVEICPTRDVAQRLADSLNAKYPI